MKAQQKSQQSQSKTVEEKPVKQEIPAPIEEEEIDEGIDEEESEDEEIPAKQEKTSVKPSNKVSDAEKNAQQIMFLQDNGIFRVELLNNLQEISKALVVIAGVLVDLSGDGNVDGKTAG